MNTRKRRKTGSKVKYYNCPPIDNIQDLINLCKSVKLYKNINMSILWKIEDDLIRLNNLIGMESLKKSILYQILYYIQSFHISKRSYKNNEYLHTLIMGPPGTGKCFSGNTNILMYNGTIKNIKYIKVNDKIMGDDSKHRTVTSIVSNYDKMYKVKQENSITYCVNKDHILSLKLIKDPTIVKIYKGKSKNILEGSLLPSKQVYKLIWYNKLGINKNYFESKKKLDNFIINIPKKGSIIDICIQDYINKSQDWKDVYQGYYVPITLSHNKTENQEENISLIKIDQWNYGYNIINTLGIFNNNVYISDILSEYNNYILAGIIDKLGHYHNKTYELKLYFPIEFEYVNNLYYNSFVDKIFYKDNNIKNIIILIKSLGYYIKIKQIGLYVKIIISGNIYNIPTKIIKNKYLETNEENKVSLSSTTPFLTNKISVTQISDDKYYGFQISGSNKRFLLEDLTVVHNTTVAKIIGNLYKNLGVLSNNGIFKIAHREDFIAEYLGQTAIKTKKLLKSCIGGVLFIDEVYSLGPSKSDKDSFSKEAIDTLTSFLSEHKHNFCCIAAGYKSDIVNCFLSRNKGLERRFPWIHKIDDYKPEELYQIFSIMIRKDKWCLDVNKNKVIEIISNNKQFFKNFGGDIETFFSKCKMVHSKRVFTLHKKYKYILNIDDIKNAMELIKENSNIKTDNKPPYGMYV